MHRQNHTLLVGPARIATMVTDRLHEGTHFLRPSFHDVNPLSVFKPWTARLSADTCTSRRGVGPVIAEHDAVGK